MTDYGLPTDIRIFAQTGDGQQIPFSLRDRGLTWSTLIPGGDGGIEFTIYSYGDHASELLPIGTHLELSDLAGPFGLGFVTNPGMDAPHRGADVRVSARGYSAALGLRRYETSTIYIQPTVGSALIAARDQLCVPPLSSTNDYLDLESLTSRSEGPSQDFIGSDALTIITSYIALGTAPPVVAPLLWEVITTPEGQPALKAGPVPSSPKYFVRIPAGAVDNPSWSLDDVDNQVIASYLDLDGHPGVVVATQSDIPLKFGLTGTPIVKSKAINVSGEFAAFDASQYAHTTLARFQDLRMSGSTITIPWGVAVLDQDGQDVPLWRVRAGERIHVTIIDEADPTGYLSTEDRFISATRWDGTSFGLTLTTGELRTETRSAQRRQAERSPAVQGNIPGLTQRQAIPLQPRPDVAPKAVVPGRDGDPGLSKYPASEEHVHPGPDPTDTIWEQLRIIATVDGKGTHYTIDSCAIPIPFACQVLGWYAVSDAPVTANVSVQFGTFAEYPAHSTSMLVAFENMRKSAGTVTTPIAVVPGSVANFIAVSLTPPTTATYLTIGLRLKRTT